MAEDNNNNSNSTIDLSALDKPPLVQAQFKSWNRTPAKLQKPDSCMGCELYSCSDGFSRPEGKGTIPLLILAEALGEAECRDGLPLRPYAPIGSVVEKAIRQLGLDRQQLVLSNVVVCRPPGNELEGTPYERAAIDQCSQYLDETIAKYRPKAILSLGNVPLQTLTGLAGKDRGIGMVRGYVFWSDKYNLPVVPTYHPSFVRRGGLKLFWVLRHDLAKALALAKGQPVDWVRAETPSELVEKAGVKYFISPGDSQILDISGYQPHSGFRLAYDIETDYSMKDEEELSAVGTQITQIQFSWMKNTGIAYTWGEIGAEGKVQEWLRSESPKAGHNAWRFDNPLLKAAGMELGGELHDTMVMWHCYQPDLPQGLQFVASFFGMRFPWKHMASQNIGVYGVADVDAVMHIWDKLPEVMKKKISPETGRSVWDGYVDYFVKLQPVLEKMQRRGIGIDVVAREELRAKVEKEKAEVFAQVQGLVPDAVKKRKVWKTWPEDLKEIKKSLETAWTEGMKNQLEAEGKRATKKATVKSLKLGDLVDTERAEITRQSGYKWDGDTLYKELDYNPSSTMQLRAILKHYKVDIPLDHLGNETTGKGELVKLLRKCKVDEVIQIIQMTMKYRQADKVIGTYIDGAGWTPDAQGRIHTTFTYKSATWQLTSTQPNIQNIPKHTPLGKDVRGLVVAAPGNLLVECVDPKTRILTWDLRWKLAKDIKVGDELVGFDENRRLTSGSSRPGRYLKKTIVEAKNIIRKPRLKIVTDKGVVICSTDHSWLCRRGNGQGAVWVKAQDLKAGDNLSHFVRPWSEVSTFDSGWLAGFLDGEGWCGQGKNGKSNGTGFGQNPGPCADHATELLTKYGFKWIASPNKSGCLQYRVTGDAFAWLRLIGKIRPIRLLHNAQKRLDGMAYWGRNSSPAKILKISSMGEGPVVALKTSSSTFIAEGMLSHNCDYSSFHVLTLGFNAESANYMRLARTDAHSYVAAHMLKTRPGVDEETREWIKDLDGWLRLDDDQLKAKLKWIKQRYGKGLRQQAKAGILGVGLGLGVDRLHSNNEESFNPSEEVAEQWLRDNPKAQFYSAIAKAMKPASYFPHSMQVMLAQEKLGKQAARDLRTLLEKLFPEVFQWQKKIRTQAHRDGFLVSRYGGIRWFHNVFEWDSKRGMEVAGEDAESSIAFFVQNDAFGKIREAMLEIDAGWCGEYMVNTVHDSLVFDVPEAKAMDLAREVKKIMERPARWLKHPRLCPEGLRCEVEVSVGRNWRDIKEVEL